MGNNLNPECKISLEHFQHTFPSLSYYMPDLATFAEVEDLVVRTCDFLSSRNMDCKDRVYTKRVKEM